MKKILLLLIFIITLLGLGGLWGYMQIYQSNTKIENPIIITINKTMTYDDVLFDLSNNNIIKSKSSFDRVAGWMNYVKANVPHGKYLIKPGMNNKEMIGTLRSGNQIPVNLIINNSRQINDLAGEISNQIELDSIDILDYFNTQENLESLGFNKDDIMTLFIPNTYQVFWNISNEKLAERLKKEHSKFWTEARVLKAEKQGLTPKETYILASIVEKESQNKSERSTIASLYLNRLKRGIMLQADPTVVYANQDFNIRRVLHKHLEYDSPYNTYKYAGLPPGPIGMSSIHSIDAVLNPAETNYLYMCAKPGYNSEHSFASTLSGHNRNADIYRRWLDKEGIR